MKLFEKEYDDESLYDLSRDIHEALFEEDMNPVLQQIGKDEYGFRNGTFVVRIDWEGE